MVNFRWAANRNWRRLTSLTVVIGSVCVGSLTWAGPAWAQSGPPEPQAVAAEHFERGLELYQEGSLDAALVEFERAYEVVPDYRVLYNLAQVQMQRGDYVSSIDLFERYLREGGTGIAASRKAEVDQDLVKLNSRVAKLWVDTNVEGAELFVNGKLVGLLPLKQPVVINSGVCDLRVVKPGFDPRTHQVKVAGGEQPRVSLPLTSSVTIRDATTTPAFTNDATNNSSLQQGEPSYTPFWISVAATVAFGGAAGGLGYLAFDSKAKMDDELARFPADRDVVAQRSNDAKDYSMWGDVCGAAAVVAAGSALYFLISPPTSTTAEQPMLSAVQLRTNGTSAVLTGKF